VSSDGKLSNIPLGRLDQVLIVVELAEILKVPIVTVADELGLMLPLKL
jgi:hypothetical protein